MPLPWVAALAAGALAAGLYARELTALPSRLPALASAIGWSEEPAPRHGAGRDFRRFASAERRALAAARRELRAEAAQSVRAALDPVFAAMKARVPAYADWYYSYPTRYLLMAHAFVAATDYTVASLPYGGPSGAGEVGAMTAHLTSYMDAQYRARVVHPRATEARLAAALAASYRRLAQHWAGIEAGRRQALRRFVEAEAGGSDSRFDAEMAASRRASADRAGMPSAAALGRLMAAERMTPAAPDDSRFAGVIVRLFSELAAPIAAQAEGVALGMASGGAVGAAAAPPVAGIVGLATTIGLGMLADQLNQRLTGAAFEQKIDGAITAAQSQTGARMNALLDRRIDRWYAEALRPYRRVGQVARSCCRPREE